MNNREKIKFSKLRLRNNASRSKKNCSPHPREKISSFFSEISTQNEIVSEEQQDEDLFSVQTKLIEHPSVSNESEDDIALDIYSTPTDHTSFNEPRISELPSTSKKYKLPDSGSSTVEDETDFEVPKNVKPTKIFEMLKPQKASKKKVHNKKNVQFGKTKFDPSTSDTNSEHLELAIAMSKSLEVFENPKIGNSSQNVKQKSFKQTLDEFGFKSDRTSSSLFVTSRYNTKHQNRKRFKHLTPTLFIRTEEERAKIIEEKVSKILTDILIHDKNGKIDNSNSQLLNNKPRSFLLRDYYNQNATLFNKNSLSLSQMETTIFYNSTVSPTDVKPGSLLKDWSSIPGREKTPPLIKIKISDSITPDLDSIPENEDKTKELSISNESNNTPKTIQVTKDKISISPDIFSDIENEDKTKEVNISNEPNYTPKTIQVTKNRTSISPDLFSDIENNEYTTINKLVPSKSVSNIDIIISSSSTIDKFLESDTSVKSVSILDSISPKRLKVKSSRNTSVLCRRNIFQNENKILLATQDDDSLSSFTDIETDSLNTQVKTKSTLKKVIHKSRNKDEDSLSSFEYLSPKKDKSKSPKKGKSPAKNKVFKNNLLTGNASLVLINAVNSTISVSPTKKSLNFSHIEKLKNHSGSSENAEIIAEHSQIMHYESFCDDNIPCFDLTISSDDSNDFGALEENSFNEVIPKSTHNEDMISNETLKGENNAQYLNEHSTDFPELRITDADDKNNDSVVDKFIPKANDRNDIIHSTEKEKHASKLLEKSAFSSKGNFGLKFNVKDAKEDIRENDSVIVLSGSSEDSQTSVETLKLNLSDDAMDDILDNSIASPIRRGEDNTRDKIYISSSEDEVNNQNITNLKTVDDLDFTSRKKNSVSPVDFNDSHNISFISKIKKRESKSRFTRSFSENMIEEYQYKSSPISRRKSISFESNKHISIKNNQTSGEGIIKADHLEAANKKVEHLLDKKSNEDMLFLSQSSFGTASDISDDELNYSCNVSLGKRRLCEEMEEVFNHGDSSDENEVEIPHMNDLPDCFFEPQRDNILNIDKPNITLSQAQKPQCKNLVFQEEVAPNISSPNVLEDRQHESRCNLGKEDLNISYKRVENEVTIAQIEELPDSFFAEQREFNFHLEEKETITSPHILKHPRINDLSTPSKINSTAQLDDCFNEILIKKSQHINVEKNIFTEIKSPDCKNALDENFDKISASNICNTSDNKILTPNRSTIIKTVNITPRGNLSDMDTPSTHKQLAKYGVKPLKRTKGIKLLKYIYDATHPISQQEKVLNSSSDSEDDRINKRRKTQQSPTFNPPASGDDNCMNNDLEIIDNDIAESENLEDMIFERTQSSKIRSCRIPFHIVWHNFVSTVQELKEKILLYEPLQVEDLYTRIKNLGFKFHMQDIISFLDKKCITIRIGQTTRMPKKKKKERKSF